MTFIADGDAFTYRIGGDELEPGLIAMGWLDPAIPYGQGDVPAEFVDGLRSICRHPLRMTRGRHPCYFCPAAHGASILTWVRHEAGDYVVGHAEIRVRGASGTRYAAPDLVIHYVEAHGYRPSDDFIAGVLAASTPQRLPQAGG